MIRPKALPRAYDLMFQGCIALAEAESNGVHIARDVLLAKQEESRSRIASIDSRLQTEEHGDMWARMRRRYGQKASIGSGDQVAAIIFSPKAEGGMGYESDRRTDSGAQASDEEAFAEVDMPWIRGWVRRNKLEKVSGTYLSGILRETVFHTDRVTGLDLWLLHPHNNLHTTDTYRSSVSNPSFQNMPIRDPQWASYIRTGIIPRPGYVLMEIDFAGAEVRVGAGYHGDPTMLHYLMVGGDMHWDVAEQLFMASRDILHKDCRGAVKGRFTFAEFYGDYYRSVGLSLWLAMHREKLCLKDGTLLIDHLRSKGITEYGDCGEENDPTPGSWLAHVKAIEEKFWKQRFPVYDKWRKDVYADYLECGEIITHTGFHSRRPMRRNVLINNPVQGSSFHCLLWAFIQINNEIKATKFPAALTAQIHDSILACVRVDKVAEYWEMCRDVIENKLKARFPFLVTGMVAEAKVSETYENGGSWFNMKVMST